MRDKNPVKKKHSLEGERRETEHYCNKMNNKKSVRAFTKKELENFFGVVCITDWRITLKNNDVLF